MKKSELFFSFVLVPLDFLMILAAGISAYNLRYAEFVQNLRPVIFNLQFGTYLQILVVIALLWLVVFSLSGLYNIRGVKKFAAEIYQIILACSTGFMLIVILIFIRRELFDSRFIILIGWILAIIYISFSRGIIRLIQRLLFKKGIGVHKIVLVGNSKTTDILISEFASSQWSGYEVVKRLRNFDSDSVQELTELLSAKEVDEIIQSDPNLSKAETLKLYDFTDEHHLTFKFAADLLGAKVLQTEVNEIAGIPIVEVKKTPLEGWGRILKRFADIFLAILFLIIFSPLLLIFSLLVKADSRGPMIYKNLRIGKDGKSFHLYKFRSMLLQYCTGEEYANQTAQEYEKELIKTQNTKPGEPIYKIANDPRVTKVGRFIRRWSIDELPQLFNVLAGDMSIVGPRPHQPREVAKYELHHKKLLTIKPGITGMAQISGRSDLTFEEEVKLDTYYVENWSLLLDFSILLRTPGAIIRSRKVE
jgi:exopolysaccharide biosynthesis polyprenyl glycosylphosphotransferase